jgi:hypothetical protein
MSPMRFLAIAIAVFAAGCERTDEPRSVLVSEASATTAKKKVRADPANVSGQWNYRTTSNCGTVEGVGNVAFVWNGRAYRETGSVYWSDSGQTIRWWGDVRYDATARRLTGTHDNSLGDKVDGNWRLEGETPDRLVVEWDQTNGCTGIGIATR